MTRFQAVSGTPFGMHVYETFDDVHSAWDYVIDKQPSQSVRMFVREEPGPARGWWGMTCFNGLSPEQQNDVLVRGVLEFGAMPRGKCQSGAAIAVETMFDETPGPRFLCGPCALAYLNELAGL